MSITTDNYEIAQHDANTFAVLYRYSGNVEAWADSEEQAEEFVHILEIKRVIISNASMGADQWSLYGDCVNDGLDAHFVNVLDTLHLSHAPRNSTGYVEEATRLTFYKAVAAVHAAYAAECKAHDLDWS